MHDHVNPDGSEQKPSLWNGPVCSMCNGSGEYWYTIWRDYKLMQKLGRCAACNGHGREPS